MDRDRDDDRYDDPRRTVERGRGRDLLGSDRHDPPASKFDPAELQANPLKVGLSMSVEIDTRKKN